MLTGYRGRASIFAQRLGRGFWQALSSRRFPQSLKSFRGGILGRPFVDCVALV